MDSKDPLAPLLTATSYGDQGAARTLMVSLEPKVRSLCAHLGSGDNVDDLVQETLMRVIAGASRFHGHSTVLTWALRIARNVCVDDVRSRQRSRRLTDRLIALRTDDVTGSMDVSHHLLNVLERPQREAFVLTQLAGLTYDEAAEIAGCPVGTIRSRVARAREALRDASERADAESFGPTGRPAKRRSA